MDTMERYRIERSIEDVIAMLDSAPMHRDMLIEENIVQLTNRAPIAHLAIERGLKALITDTGATREDTHSLKRLYRALIKCDEKSAIFLDKAFKDAIDFFGFNANIPGLRHLRSLDDYLSKTGHDNAFNALRYWAIGEQPNGVNPIYLISLSVHRELLCAVASVVRPGPNETVSERVEHVLRHAMHPMVALSYSPNDTRKRRSVESYRHWLLSEHKNLP